MAFMADVEYYLKLPYLNLCRVLLESRQLHTSRHYKTCRFLGSSPCFPCIIKVLKRAGGAQVASCNDDDSLNPCRPLKALYKNPLTITSERNPQTLNPKSPNLDPKPHKP